MKKRLLTALSILILVSSACFPGPERNYEQDTKDAEDRISKDETLKNLDRLCQELPRPHDFEYLGKIAGNNKKFVGYRYQTSLNYSGIKEFYDDYFQQNGWQLFEERPNWGAWFGYKKNEVSISITSFDSDNKAAIDCSNRS